MDHIGHVLTEDNLITVSAGEDQICVVAYPEPPIVEDDDTIYPEWVLEIPVGQAKMLGQLILHAIEHAK